MWNSALREKFNFFFSSYVTTGEGTLYTVLNINNHASFHWQWKKNLLISQNVSKYYEHSCLQNFLSVCMSLWTALIVINSHILAGIYWIFQKKLPRLILHKILTSVKRLEKQSSSQTNINTFSHISVCHFRLKLCQRP